MLQSSEEGRLLAFLWNTYFSLFASVLSLVAKKSQSFTNVALEKMSESLKKTKRDLDVSLKKQHEEHTKVLELQVKLESKRDQIQLNQEMEKKYKVQIAFSKKDN